MNDVLKIYPHREQRLFELVQAFDLAMAWLRHEEARLDAEIEHTSPLPMTEMHYLEQHAAKIYTRRIFLKVRVEMKSQGMYYRYNGMDDGVQCVYFISHAYSSKQWRVLYNRNSEIMQCSCQQMETLGLPYCHMFKIMVIERMKKLPSNCIIGRWTKQARCRANVVCKGRSEVTNVNEIARFARLASACNIMCFYAAKTISGYTHLLDVIEIETIDMKMLSLDSQNEVDCSSCRQEYGIGDPKVTRGKRDEKKIIKENQIHNKCRNCGSRNGHNRRTCPLELTNASDDLSHNVDVSQEKVHVNLSSDWIRACVGVQIQRINEYSVDTIGEVQWIEGQEMDVNLDIGSSLDYPTW